jgi:hypothetical protein
VDALGLATVALGDWEEVEDPAGGEVEVFHACAAEVQDLTTQLAGQLADRVAG